jgi:hypothetical protein
MTLARMAMTIRSTRRRLGESGKAFVLMMQAMNQA